MLAHILRYQEQPQMQLACLVLMVNIVQLARPLALLANRVIIVLAAYKLHVVREPTSLVLELH